MPSTRDLTTLQDLSWQASVEVLPELPEARSVIDASLRGLTGAGIIGMVVDSAPVVAEVSPPPTGFWARFFGSMFIPAQ